MAAGQGFKTFTTGEVLTAADVNGYLMQGINVFASSAARSAAITSPQEGQYSFLKDTNALEYYDGAAWVGAPVGDITAVTAGKGLTGGGSSGDVTVALATTAKGDLVAGSGASTAAVLSVGANGETLVADSSTSTGLRYTAGTVSDNPILNSSMQVWQRGTSFALASGTITYTADRWAAYRNATGSTVTRQATSDTTNLPFIQYCVRVSRDSGNTSTSAISIGQSFESINSIPFAGKTVTFSFYARKGANFSGAGIDAVLYSGTGTDQNYVNGFTGAANVGVVSSALTTTWTRYSVTGTVGTNVTQLATYFNYYGPTGTAGAADNFEITGVQVDVGSVALPYRSTTGTIQAELAACRRYLPAFDSGSSPLSYIGYFYSGTSGVYTIPFDVPARVAPTGITTSGSFTAYDLNTGTSVTPVFSSAGKTALSLTVGSLSVVQGRGSRLDFGNGATILLTGCEL